MSSVSTVLAIETTLGECSAAIWRENMLVSHRHVTQRNQQTKMLIPMIADIMNKAEISFQQLRAIAVTNGPGSFTGIRVGLATARGLAFASNLPIIAITNLELLAWQAVSCLLNSNDTHNYNYRNIAHMPIYSMINAYRSQVYIQKFKLEATGKSETATTANQNMVNIIAQSEASLINVEDIPTLLPTKKDFIVAGNCDDIVANSNISANYICFADAKKPHAAALAEYIALTKNTSMLLHNNNADAFYIRPADAKPQTALISN